MKRIPVLFPAALFFSLTASTAFATPRWGLGDPTSCAGLSAGAACDTGLAVGVCAPGESDAGADGGDRGDGADAGDAAVAEDGGDGGPDAGLVCTFIPLGAGCEGKPEGAICLMTGGGQGHCIDESDGGSECDLFTSGDASTTSTGADSGSSTVVVSHDGGSARGTSPGTDGGGATENEANDDSGGGCTVGSPDTSLALSLLGLLVPVVMRRRRRQDS